MLGFILYHQVYITRINRPNYVDLIALFSFRLDTVKLAYKNLQAEIWYSNTQKYKNLIQNNHSNFDFSGF